MLAHRSLTNLALLMVKITFLIVEFIIGEQPEEFQNGKNSNMPNRRDSGKMEEIKLNSYDLDVHMMYKCNTFKSYNGGSEPSAPAELR